MNREYGLTKEEATRLIQMLKEYVNNKKSNVIWLPNVGKSLEFEVIGQESKEKFIININRRTKDKNKYTFQGRTKLENNLLMRLDIATETTVHMNPDGTKIRGSHLHIYTPEYDMAYATIFDADSSNVVENCIKFFNEFHIIRDNNEIVYQEEI